MKLRRFARFAAVLAAAAGVALAGASTAGAAPVDGCSAVHPGECGTWQNTDNGQYLSVVGNPQKPSSSATTWFNAQQGVARSTSFLMTHPAAYSGNNGALVQWSNAGRNSFGKYLACTPHSAVLGLVNVASPAGGDTDWVYDGTGFTCMGRYLVLSKTGGVIGSATTSANPADESPTAFIPAS